ncbi:DUF3830 family protein [Pseudomonas bohemica]|uniref:DUF3830 family protein n=1 Tax=Pseudomonas bohemica TaxID=2044872 RepID=UPI000DA63EF1|nr:DUF3830 family protein [Pseudomonas bohemica]
MRLRLKVEGQSICLIEIWEDKVPNLAKIFREKLPLQSSLQHGKLLGDLVFFTLPIVAPWENRYLTQDVGRERIAKTGHAAGAVCFYSPRQQLCIVYGDDVSAEPLPISYIGEVIEGALQLKVTGMETWFEQGALVELEIAD